MDKQAKKRRYVVYNTSTGAILGEYKAESPYYALAMLADDANGDLESLLGDDEIQIDEID